MIKIDDMMDLLEIDKEVHGLNIITGQSGSGKSNLAIKLISDHHEKGIRTAYCSSEADENFYKNVLNSFNTPGIYYGDYALFYGDRSVGNGDFDFHLLSGNLVNHRTGTVFIDGSQVFSLLTSQNRDTLRFMAQRFSIWLVIQASRSHSREAMINSLNHPLIALANHIVCVETFEDASRISVTKHRFKTRMVEATVIPTIKQVPDRSIYELEYLNQYDNNPSH